MDPRQMETLVQRLVHNPHDQEAIDKAHHQGQSDPRSYAMLLEKVGGATADGAYACHWLTEAANVWSTTLGDAHRAARALMLAIDRDPTQPTPAERLADLYREKGDTKALVALLERRVRALTPLAPQNSQLYPQLGAIHEELGRLWSEPPLAQAKKAAENYRRAVEYDPTNLYATYGLRELLKAAGQWSEAVPLFEAEQRLIADPERQVALFQDEADVRRNAGDLNGATHALRQARAIEGGQDPTLKQLLATSVLDRVQASENVAAAERREGAELFIELAEEYPGEHGYSYSSCALELEPGHDRAVQLVMYYGEQLGRSAEAAPRAAEYLKHNPQGALFAEARALVTRMMEAGGDESMLEALAPPPGAEDSERVAALLEMAQALARKAKKGEAAQRYKEVVALDPGHPDAVGFLEGYLRQTRKFADLRELLLNASRASTADEEQRKRWLKEAATLSEGQLRDVDGAVSALEGVVTIDPEDEEATGQLRRLLERAQRWDQLAALLQRQAEQIADTEARLTLEKQVAKIHEQRRKDPVATGDAWARIAALTPDDEAAIATAVRAYEKGNRPDLAAQVIADNVGSVGDEDTRAALYRELGQLREAAGDAAGAGDAFSEAASLSQLVEDWEAGERCFAAASAWEQAASAADEAGRLSEGERDKAEALSRVADYLARAGDAAGALSRLEQATDLDPVNEELAQRLEECYLASEQPGELAAFLLRRADKLSKKEQRIALRKRAAKLQRETLADADASRLSLTALLEDGDDAEALGLLADDAAELEDHQAALEYLDRLAKVIDDPGERAKVRARAAAIAAEGLEQTSEAIERYRDILVELGKDDPDILRKIGDLCEKDGDIAGATEALERLLAASDDDAVKLEVAGRLADMYEGELDDPKRAVTALRTVRKLDPEDFDALARLCELSEKVEDWEAFVEYQGALVEIEGDENEISRMTRRMAEVYSEKLDKGDEALAALMQIADRGDEACREEYITLGDKLGWKGVVAQKLVEWYIEAPVSPRRNEALRGAFDRFIAVGRDADAANVAKELVRTKGADAELAERLEAIAVKLKDLDALGIAHDLQVVDLSGIARAEEMVRQAEVMVEASVDSLEAIQRGEQALTSVSPDEVEPLLQRLAKLAAEPAQVTDLYERQVTRCKAPADRLRALGRAAQVAAENSALDRARRFFDIALGGGVQEETLGVLEDMARETDLNAGGPELRRTLAEAMAAGGQGSRDGGRTRSFLLGRAAELVFQELKDVDRAFGWLAESLVAHVDDDRLEALERLATEVDDLKRAESVLSRALEEVFDGPLVRKLLDRRASLREGLLRNLSGAADDLKRLHDLSPSDSGVMERLSELYTRLEDYRGMVQLYEDQILRGKEPAARAELARKVARLWEEKLDDPREAADAWRRVLRMKQGDPEATEGLERSKANMLKRPKPVEPEPEPTERPSEAKSARRVELPEPPAAEESPAGDETSVEGASKFDEAADERAGGSEGAGAPGTSSEGAAARGEHRLSPPAKKGKKKKKSTPPPDDIEVPIEAPVGVGEAAIRAETRAYDTGPKGDEEGEGKPPGAAAAEEPGGVPLGTDETPPAPPAAPGPDTDRSPPHSEEAVVPIEPMEVEIPVDIAVRAPPPPPMRQSRPPPLPGQRSAPSDAHAAGRPPPPGGRVSRRPPPPPPGRISGTPPPPMPPPQVRVSPAPRNHGSMGVNEDVTEVRPPPGIKGKGDDEPLNVDDDELLD
ncbi:MAG TPA: hypothetical protein VF989_07060 [Polyangiaceae bacterium]